MCCLFGIFDYGGNLSRKQKTKILSVLSVECEERGTDATGIAYNAEGSLKIYKRPLPAHLLWFRIYENTRAVMGHTRMTTQGCERFNANNHPFPGTAGGTNFALAHNGVLHNDARLRREHKLPATRIETDSYVAAQLLEAAGEISFASLAGMAELLEGSFTITVMTDKDELFFVRGNNPMCIYHYEKLGFYLYASTEEILKCAVRLIPLKLGRATKVHIDSGEILKIDTRGQVTMGHFDDSKLLNGCRSWSKWFLGEPTLFRDTSADEGYINDLKAVGMCHGLWPEEIDELLADGVSAEEIEELIYGG